MRAPVWTHIKHTHTHTHTKLKSPLIFQSLHLGVKVWESPKHVPTAWAKSLNWDFFGLYEKDSNKKLLLTLIGISVRGISILYRNKEWFYKKKQDKSNLNGCQVGPEGLATHNWFFWLCLRYHSNSTKPSRTHVPGPIQTWMSTPSADQSSKQIKRALMAFVG